MAERAPSFGVKAAKARIIATYRSKCRQPICSSGDARVKLIHTRANFTSTCEMSPRVLHFLPQDDVSVASMHKVYMHREIYYARIKRVLKMHAR